MLRVNFVVYVVGVTVKCFLYENVPMFITLESFPKESTP